MDKAKSEEIKYREFTPQRKPVFKYTDTFGNTTDVVFCVSEYENGNLHLKLENIHTGEFVTDVTVDEDIKEAYPHKVSLVNEHIAEFLIENNLGFSMKSTETTNPRFFLGKLSEVDPVGMHKIFTADKTEKRADIELMEASNYFSDDNEQTQLQTALNYFGLKAWNEMILNNFKNYKNGLKGGKNLGKIRDIKSSEFGDDFVCECGNHCADSGFYFCDKNGNITESTDGNNWDGDSICGDCDLIYHEIYEKGRND
jgi:hypothetical protein